MSFSSGSDCGVSMLSRCNFLDPLQNSSQELSFVWPGPNLFLTKVYKIVRLEYCAAHSLQLICQGYNQTFSSEIFRIKKVLPTFPYTYKLADTSEQQEDIGGSYYSQQLAVANPDQEVSHAPPLEPEMGVEEPHPNVPVVQEQPGGNGEQ